MKPLIIHPVQTEIFRAGNRLPEFIAQSIPKALVHEGMLAVVTSKIVSLSEGRLVARGSIEKEALVRQESDVYLGQIGYGCFLTIKCGLMIPSAGIDESNSEQGDYILFPKDPYRSAEELRLALRKIWKIEKLGVLITDSHTSPLRRGVTGICLSYAGFHALRNMVGSKDLFGRELRMTQMNLADGLAAAAVLMMGEGAEARPLGVIENADVEFTATPRQGEVEIPYEEDLYYPLIRSFLER